MNKNNKKLDLAVDMYGCPNRCKHCWLGHMPNKKTDENIDKYIVDYFRPYFDTIVYYSWLREPDYCNDYKERWKRDNMISVGEKPERFELASFYRLVRDKEYVGFLKSIGVKTVQLTFFGMDKLTNRYIGRRTAFSELLLATDILLKNKIAPRWQAFINEENKYDIPQLLRLIKILRLDEICRSFGQEFKFSVYEGSADGENRKLYDRRILKENIPQELIPYYFEYDKISSESELCEKLSNDPSHFVYHNKDRIVLNISNEMDVYYNFTHMHGNWKIGNLIETPKDEMIDRIMGEKVPALEMAKQITVSELIKLYGNKSSHRVFRENDYKAYLLNCYVDAH